MDFCSEKWPSGRKEKAKMTLRVMGPHEWLASLPHMVGYATVALKSSGEEISLHGFRVTNHDRSDGHWEVEVFWDGRWRDALFHFVTKMLKMAA